MTGGRALVLRRADVDEVVDQLEVVGVVGEQRDLVDVGGGGDGEVERAPAGLAAAGAYGGGEPAPFACGGGVERERFERGFDYAESQASARAFVVVARRPGRRSAVRRGWRR